jgi:beta-galactosidase beta subunit
MKYVMSTTSAFVRRHVTSGATSGYASLKSSVVGDHKLPSSVLSSPILHPTGTLRCYSTLWESSLMNSGFYTATSAYNTRRKCSSALLQSIYSVQQQPVSAPSTAISNYAHQQHQIRSMASNKNKESKNQKNKAKQKSMIKKQKLQQEQQKANRQQQKKEHPGVVGGDEHSAITASTATTTTNTNGGAAEQHKEWVEFQKSIEVDGFETGQTLTTVDSSKKGRSGGKATTKKRMTKRDEMAEKIKERQRLAGAGGGEFPPMRYSDEETERLLKQAYAAIPKRMGRRGTLQLKRQKRRWHLVREIHRKYKANIIKFHFRRMQRRSTKIKQIVDFISNVAPNTVHEDIEYQNSVRQRYMNMMETAAASRAAKIAETTNPSTLEHL